VSTNRPFTVWSGKVAAKVVGPVGTRVIVPLGVSWARGADAATARAAAVSRVLTFMSVLSASPDGQRLDGVVGGRQELLQLERLDRVVDVQAFW
jgi:hypothetical protein